MKRVLWKAQSQPTRKGPRYGSSRDEDGGKRSGTRRSRRRLAQALSKFLRLALLPAVLITPANAETPNCLRKTPTLRHQHASKRYELVFLRSIQLRVQGLGSFDDLVETCLALRKALRLCIQAIHRRQVAFLLLLQGDHARLFGVPDCGFKRAPVLLLVRGQPEARFHALELGVYSRLRPMLGELRVGRLLIALGGRGETASGDGNCGGRREHP